VLELGAGSGSPIVGLNGGMQSWGLGLPEEERKIERKIERKMRAAG
jgi:hypothetical protein